MRPGNLYIRWPDGATDEKKLADIMKVLESLERTKQMYRAYAYRHVTHEQSLTRRFFDGEMPMTAGEFLELLAKKRMIIV